LNTQSLFAEESIQEILIGGEIIELVGVRKAQTKKTMMTFKEEPVINAFIFLKDEGRENINF
jgi:hypothetical protein